MFFSDGLHTFPPGQEKMKKGLPLVCDSAEKQLHGIPMTVFYLVNLELMFMIVTVHLITGFAGQVHSQPLEDLLIHRGQEDSGVCLASA